MNKKIRAIICLCSFTMVAIYTIELLLGKLNFIGKITLYICYGMYVFVIIYNLLIVLQKTSENKKWYNKSYNIFEIGCDSHSGTMCIRWSQRDHDFQY